MNNDFKNAQNTVILSDIHLADAEKPHPLNPLWKKFKQEKYFIDSSFKCFLDYVQAESNSKIELILNGDIFDFDAIMRIPKAPGFKVSWLERVRGLSSEEQKSRFKMKIILDSHPIWLDAFRKFIVNGNRAVFIIGNHDMELHWPSVRNDLLERLDLSVAEKSNIRFCEWFYISNGDTLVEHGNQYDSYCICSNPIHPLVKIASHISVRLPFGNLAGKYMINGMGLMNPHATGTYIKESIWEYLRFYYRYMMRTQPFLLWTWFWSALVTLIYSVSEGFLPAMSDPLTVDARIEDIAQRGNASVNMVLALKEVHVHPAIFNPVKILRELWLDRVLLLGVIILGSFQFFSFLNVFTSASIWWFILPLFILLPLFVFYARSVQSEVDAAERAALLLAPISAQITKVKRIVQGHTHHECHQFTNGLEVINTGTWSPAYHDVECMQPYGRKCFAWIKPSHPGAPEREACLFEWTGTHAVPIAVGHRT